MGWLLYCQDLSVAAGLDPSHGVEFCVFHHRVSFTSLPLCLRDRGGGVTPLQMKWGGYVEIGQAAIRVGSKVVISGQVGPVCCGVQSDSKEKVL